MKFEQFLFECRVSTFQNKLRVYLVFNYQGGTPRHLSQTCWSRFSAISTGHALRLSSRHCQIQLHLANELMSATLQVNSCVEHPFKLLVISSFSFSNEVESNQVVNIIPVRTTFFCLSAAKMSAVLEIFQGYYEITRGLLGNHILIL